MSLQPGQKMRIPEGELLLVPELCFLTGNHAHTVASHFIDYWLFFEFILLVFTGGVIKTGNRNHSIN